MSFLMCSLFRSKPYSITYALKTVVARYLPEVQVPDRQELGTASSSELTAS